MVRKMMVYVLGITFGVMYIDNKSKTKVGV